MKRITTDYIRSRHPFLGRLMQSVGLLQGYFAFYEARFQYRDQWASGGYPHIIVACPNNTLYRIYINKEFRPFYEQLPESFKIYSTGQGDQYEYVLTQNGLSVPILNNTIKTINNNEPYRTQL